MSDFKVFSDAVNHNLETMCDDKDVVLLVSDIDGDVLWDTYIKSFPVGTNNMFRNRTEHECSACRNFVTRLGRVVAVKNGKIVATVWDGIETGDEYEVVSKALSKKITAGGVEFGKFTEAAFGSRPNKDSTGVVWSHFYGVTPSSMNLRMTRASHIGGNTDSVAILLRTIKEFTQDALDIVMELIESKVIYRAEEYKGSVQLINKLINNAPKSKRALNIYCHEMVGKHGSVVRVRNTAIGELLTSLSIGVDIETAVGAYERMVAPSNYKRSSALVTPRMIEDAKKTATANGIPEELFVRRHATRNDISASDVLFIQGNTNKNIGGVFESLTPTKVNQKDKREAIDIGVEEFIRDVLPKVSSVEALVGSDNMNRFMSIVAPAFDVDTKLFKWGNNLSWSYGSDTTDSVRERVKRAGGKVDGYARVSLSWHDGDDLDLYVRSKRTVQTIRFSNRRAFGAYLDVDMNAGVATNSTDPIENVVWERAHDLADGEYEILVHNFRPRTKADIGYEVEVEVNGKLISNAYPRKASNIARLVGSFTIKNKEIVSHQGFTEGAADSEKWGIKSGEWVPVDLITKSPNAWGEKPVGIEHMFFILRDCRNPDPVRGFYNEFLRDDLFAHRKVFELLASSMKVEYDDTQLSGVGFSLSQSGSLTVRVSGQVNAKYNINFKG